MKFFIICLLCLIAISHARREFVLFDFDCNSYTPHPPMKGSSCQDGLINYPEQFEECRTGNKTCFFFVDEEPFTSIKYDPKSDRAVEFQKPFKCGDFKKAFGSRAQLFGSTFEILKLTAGAEDLCTWVGPKCEFNEIVDFIEIQAKEKYRLAIIGNLLETPQRQCRHEASVANANDVMVILGRREIAISSVTPILQLFRPFKWGGWLIFILTFMTFVLVSFVITWKIHAYRSGAIGDAIQLFLGQNGTTRLENEIRFNDGEAAARAFSARNGVVTSLFRVSIGACILIFILFYEVAIAIRLFRENVPELSQRVSKLSMEDLQSYGVLKNSALESVWLAAVDPAGYKFKENTNMSYPWKRCEKATECVEFLKSGDIDFMVTFGIEAKVFLSDTRTCEEFALYETQDDLFVFNAGNLFNSVPNQEQRKRIDRELLALRINGKFDKILQNEIGRKECSTKLDAAILPITILIPVLGLVLPPLLCALLALFFWKRIDADLGNTEVIGNDSDSLSNSAEEDAKKFSVDTK